MSLELSQTISPGTRQAKLSCLCQTRNGQDMFCDKGSHKEGVITFVTYYYNDISSQQIFRLVNIKRFHVISFLNIVDIYWIYSVVCVQLYIVHLSKSYNVDLIKKIFSEIL